MIETRGRKAGASTRRGQPASFFIIAVFGAAALAGIALGGVSYVRRSHVLHKHAGGTNAIEIHLALAVVALGAVLFLYRYRQHLGGSGRCPLWPAPFSKNALSRFTATIRCQRGTSPRNVLRAVASAALVVLEVYVPLRMGEQIIGGLDPNSAINAWGGPSYAGALAAHWMDSILMFYAVAFLLSRLLLRSQESG